MSEPVQPHKPTHTLTINPPDAWSKPNPMRRVASRNHLRWYASEYMWGTIIGLGIVAFAIAWLAAGDHSFLP